MKTRSGILAILGTTNYTTATEQTRQLARACLGGLFMGTDSVKTVSRPNKFREVVLWGIAGTIGAWATAQWSPAASGILAAALGAFVFLRVTERIVIKQISAWRTIGVFWLAMMFAIQGWSAYARQDRLAAMERASPAAYLSYIKRTQEDSFWLVELKRLDPKAFEAEVRRREQARAEQVAVEADRAAELEPDRQWRSRGGSADYSANEWYSGGTLHHGTGSDWRRADEANRLATAADLVGEILGEQHVAALGSIDALRPFAAELQICIDEATAVAEGRNLKITELAAGCAILLGNFTQSDARAIADPPSPKDRKVSGADDNVEATATLVGRRCDKIFPGSNDGNIEIAIVTGADGKSERLRFFFDGSRSRDPLKFRGNAFWHVGSSSGDHYKIASTGELQLFDEEGFIRMAFPVARGQCVKN